MELRQLSYFVAVAEELHFGRAAQRLGISQPPLSQQIKSLEADVGARLFNRDRHTVRLTDAGQAALAEAYQLLERADRLKAIARQVNAGVDSRLSIGCSSSVLFEVLPPILERLRADHPTIGLSVEEYETKAAVPALLAEKLDVAFIRTDTAEPPLEARFYVRDHYIAAIPSRHPLARRKTVSIRSLVNEPLIVYKRRMEPGTHDRIIAACRAEGFAPNFVFQSHSMQSQIGMVACGLGIGIVPNLVRHWSIPRVVYRQLETPIEATGISIVWHSRRRSDALERLLDAAQKASSDLAAAAVRKPARRK